MSNPDYKNPSNNSKSGGVKWLPYPEVDLKYGESTGYVTTAPCRVLQIDIHSSEGSYRFNAD